MTELKAQDLRVGNYVWLHKDGNKKIYQIDSGYDLYKLDESYCADISPIEITEKILIDLGAYWEDVLQEKDALVIDVTEDIGIGWCGYLFLIVNGYVIQINNANSEYLHELQNIYKDLSGKELDFKS